MTSRLDSEWTTVIVQNYTEGEAEMLANFFRAELSTTWGSVPEASQLGRLLSKIASDLERKLNHD